MERPVYRTPSRPRGRTATLQGKTTTLSPELSRRTGGSAAPGGGRTEPAAQDIEGVLRLQNEEMTTRMAHVRHHQGTHRRGIENSDRPVFEVLFAKVNVDRFPELARQETGVPAIPALASSRKRRAEERFVGAHPYDELSRVLGPYVPAATGD